MTTLFLSTTGGTLGSSFLGPIGKFAGAQLGTYVGARLDSIIFGLDKTLPLMRPPHLGDLNVQTSTYGKVIPIIYGSAKIAGNIIWATPIKEVREESTIGSGVPEQLQLPIMQLWPSLFVKVLPMSSSISTPMNKFWIENH